MRLKKIYDAADAIAPFALLDEYCGRYHGRDNSGVQLDCGDEIAKILFSLDLSRAAVKRARERGADCIFTHHPAIFDPLLSLQREGEGDKILACAQEGISVLSAHLNLDVAEGGIDDCLMQGLGGIRAEKIMQPLDGGGYGKLFSVPERALSAFAEEVGETFGTQKALVYGNRPVEKIASFCGAGTDGESVAFAAACGADTFVSSDAKHHLVAELVEKGLNVVLLTHYAAENYGFKKFYEKIKENLKEAVACEFFADGALL